MAVSGPVLIDTNALVTHFVDGTAPVVAAAIGTDLPAFVTNLAVVEFRSTLAKLVRNAAIPFSRSDYLLFDKAFTYELTLGGLTQIGIRKKFVSQASRLIERYGLDAGLSLRTLDCLHLMSALDLKGASYPNISLITDDQPLHAVAKAAGLSVLGSH